MGPRPRVAIDTNILISGLFWRGAPHLLLELARAGELHLIIPDFVKEEARRVVSKLKKGGTTLLDRFLHDVRLYVQQVPIPSREEVEKVSGFVRDATDAPILASVLAVRPDYFVSGDEDFLSPKTRRRCPVPILSTSAFLEIFLRTAASRLQKDKPSLYLKLLLYVTAE